LATAVVLLALLALALVSWGVRWYQVQSRRHAVAEALAVPTDRLLPMCHRRSFKFVTEQGEWQWQVHTDTDGVIWQVAFHLPYPDSFSWEQQGLEGSVETVRSEVARFFGEDPAALECECVRHTGVVGYVVCHSSPTNWTYGAKVVDLGIMRITRAPNSSCFQPASKEGADSAAE